MFVSSLWCLAGLAHSEIIGVGGVGSWGFGMRLGCTGGFYPSCVMHSQASSCQKQWGACSTCQLLSTGISIVFLVYKCPQMIVVEEPANELAEQVLE